MNLRDIKVSTKTAWIPFPSMEGFEVEVCFLSRELSTKINEDSKVTKLDKKLKTMVSEIDVDIFVEKFTKATIKGWKGLKLKYVAELMPVDLSSLDPEDTLDFSEDNAVELLKSSSAFDSWVNEVVFDLSRFQG